MAKILGVDHICTSCNNIDLASTVFQNFQYDTMFIEHGLQSPEEKKPYLKNFTKNHDAVFLKSDKGLAIEVIDHKSKPNKLMGPYRVLFIKKNDSDKNIQNIIHDPIKKVIEKSFGFSVSLNKISDLGISYFNHEGSSYNGLSAVIIECKNLVVSSNFWEKGIGFRIIKASKDELSWCLMEFPGLVSSMKIKLLLIETKNTKTKSYLDYSGWTCLSFMVQGIDSTLKEVKKYGALDIGEPYKMLVGGNNLYLSFFRGPDGELIEFLELSKNSKINQNLKAK